MAFKSVHFSALAMGTTAIGALIGVYYYYHKAQTDEASAAAAQASPQPFFQTAAAPAVMGATGTSASSAATGSGSSTAGTASTLDPNALLTAALTEAATSSAAQTGAQSQANQLTASTGLAGIGSAIIQQLQSIASPTGPGGSVSVTGDLADTINSSGGSNLTYTGSIQQLGSIAPAPPKTITAAPVASTSQSGAYLLQGLNSQGQVTGAAAAEGTPLAGQTNVPVQYYSLGNDATGTG